MRVLVTGVAGFIGFHCARMLLGQGHEVIGIDNLNDYYDIALKQARLAELGDQPEFRFLKLDIADDRALFETLADESFDTVLHLAAQAGVRASIDHPHLYISANVAGHLNVLELCRHSGGRIRHLVYASSSSVYGRNDKRPFSEADRVDQPVSLYAATKRSDELISEAYAGLYDLPITGLRFFTVYGPWGRPDMAVWKFTEAVLTGRPVMLFNAGRMRRDFTYIDDVVTGTLSITTGSPPSPGARVYNIGNNRSEGVPRLLALIEEAAGRKAIVEEAPMQSGDVEETYADISRITADYGYSPTTPIEVGIPRFVDWYRTYSGR